MCDALPAPRASRRVLVVDDVAMNRRLLATLLDQDGHEAVTAASGVEALALLEQAPFDLVLMDLHMPGMDGIAALHAIRARHPRLPVVAVTADLSPGAEAECRGAGFDGVLAKPLEWARLRRAVLEGRIAA
jgi:CheY-like chemotaxis protein